MGKKNVMAELKPLFEYWSYMVAGLGWKLSVVYHDSYEDMPEGTSTTAVAYTTCEFKYLDAVIHVNLRLAKDLKKDDLVYVVIHELVHLLVSPLVESSEVTPHEYTVTTIARIIQGLGRKND